MLLGMISSQAFLFDTWFINKWQDQITNDGILFPISDVAEGGNSGVLDLQGNVISECLETDVNRVLK